MIQTGMFTFRSSDASGSIVRLSSKLALLPKTSGSGTTAHIDISGSGLVPHRRSDVTEASGVGAQAGRAASISSANSSAHQRTLSGLGKSSADSLKSVAEAPEDIAADVWGDLLPSTPRLQEEVKQAKAMANPASSSTFNFSARGTSTLFFLFRYVLCFSNCAHKCSSDSVSYTHLTLPTNREV